MRTLWFVILCLTSAFFVAACGARDGFEVRRSAPAQEAHEEVSRMKRSSRLQDDVEAYLREHQPGPLPRLFQTTHVYDRNGTLIAELFNEGRREWVSLDKISPFLIEATISTEDATFRTNLGVDPFRVAGAALENVKQGKVVSGASTITMQLARNLFLPVDERYEHSIDRKRMEAEIARELTRAYTKDEILEMYLNLLNYGHLSYGPEAAAKVYFGKSAAALTEAEATLLAGLPQQPAYLDPYLNFEAAKGRQRQVLNLMVRKLKMTQREADRIYDQPLLFVGDPGAAPPVVPHFVQYIENKIAVQTNEHFLRRSGLDIITSIDLRAQELAQTTASEWVSKLNRRYGMTNAALVAMRPGSGELIALIGSLDFYDEEIDGQVNVALSQRQPGSAIKPILYAIAMDDLVISPATVIWDTPVTYDGGSGSPYKPTNYDFKFHGLVTVRTALANSYNVPAVKVIDALGVRRMLEVGRQMGLRSLTRADNEYGLPLSLGEGEVTLMDLTTAFHTIANSGRFIEPKTILSALDKHGNQSSLVDEILQADQPTAPQQVLSPGTAFVMTDIMSDNNARRPMFGLNSRLHLSHPAAAKTGTTTGWKDNWTMGYSRHLVTGVWVGNSDGTPMRNSTGASGAAPIWHDFMEAMMADPDMQALLGTPTDPEDAGWEFVPPDDVVLVDECPLNLACRKGGEYFTSEWVEATGDLGPLADTMITAPVIPVHEGQAWLPIYCMPETGGEERTLVNLDSMRSLKYPPDPNKIVAEQAGVYRRINYPSEARSELVFYPENQLERFRKLAWSRYRGKAVNVGQCAELQFYEVQPGDYWSKLASELGMKVGELQTSNAHILRAGGVLRTGDRLLIPNGYVLEVNEGGDTYVVESGDTWSTIGQNFGISLGLLFAANPAIMRINYLLKPGDEVLIPTVLGAGS